MVSAVVGMEDDIKGHSVYAYVSLKIGYNPSDDLKRELIQTVRTSISPIAVPDNIQWSDVLPKTRSGKIMRRILRKIANNDVTDLGDLTTLADPNVVDVLIQEKDKDSTK